MVHTGGNQNVTDPLTGQGKAFAVGIRHYGAVVQSGKPGEGSLAVVKLAIRLVTKQIDLGAQLHLLLFQHGGKCLQAVLGIDRAGGIVGRVEHHHLGLFVDRRLHCLQIELEGGLMAQYGNQNATRLFHEHAILGEEGSGNHHLVSRVQDRVERAGQRCGGAAGHIDHGRIRLEAEARLDGIRNGGTYPHITRGRGVSVKLAGIHFFHQLGNGLANGVRCGDAGIAQRKIVHVFRADLLLSLCAIFADGADHRRLLSKLKHFL